MIRANLIDLFTSSVYEIAYEIKNGKIAISNKKVSENPDLPYILPGFVDAHVHIESSMLTPPQFARMAVVHGTVGSVSDPHEIANVLDIKGVEYMIKESKRVPFKFCLGAPSCVPATTFETAGAKLSPDDINYLLSLNEIGYLAEMMNFPGILNEDPVLMKILELAKSHAKPIDGHAPGLRGEDAEKYISFGISTDHECVTFEEAEEKIHYGASILIREGCAARNFDALIPLFTQYPEKLMFCSDDKHPDMLAKGHINLLVKRSIQMGYNVFDVLRAACVNPVMHYQLNIGLLRDGDPADFIEIDNMQNFSIQKTYINGELVASDGISNIPDLRSEHLNNFNCKSTLPQDFEIIVKENTGDIKVIEALDGQLITRQSNIKLPVTNGKVNQDPDKDILKIAVINRYNPAPVSVAFVKGFGIKNGAIASSVAHDSHNIIVVGTNDTSMSVAANEIIKNKGGLSAYVNQQIYSLSLPIAGIMTDTDGYEVARQYAFLDQCVKKEMGSTLRSPFMTLSFMALLVIPKLKISDLGLFDTSQFSLVSLYNES